MLKSLKECAERTRVRPTMIIIDDPVTLTKEQRKDLAEGNYKGRLYTGSGTFFGVDPAGEGKDVGAITMVKHHRDCGKCFREHYF